MGFNPRGVNQKSLEEGGRDFVMAKLGETIHPMKESFLVAFLNCKEIKEENTVVPKAIAEFREKHGIKVEPGCPAAEASIEYEARDAAAAAGKATEPEKKEGGSPETAEAGDDDKPKATVAGEHAEGGDKTSDEKGGAEGGESDTPTKTDVDSNAQEKAPTKEEKREQSKPADAAGPSEPGSDGKGAAEEKKDDSADDKGDEKEDKDGPNEGDKSAMEADKSVPAEPISSHEGNKPDADEPDADMPDADKPEADKPEADKADADEADADKADADKTDADKADADKADADKADADKADADKADADEADADKADADKPDSSDDVETQVKIADEAAADTTDAQADVKMEDVSESKQEGKEEETSNEKDESKTEEKAEPMDTDDKSPEDNATSSEEKKDASEDAKPVADADKGEGDANDDSKEDEKKTPATAKSNDATSNAVDTSPDRGGKFAAMAAKKRDAEGNVKADPDAEEKNGGDDKDAKDKKEEQTMVVKDSKGRTVKILDDDDEELDCEFLNNRQAFLNLCQGNHYQFDQLRRAKHSSMMVLWHLHNRDAPKFVQQCAVCSREILQGFRYHCPTCADYDLCQECVQNPNTPRHPHQLKPVAVASGQQQQMTEEQRKERQRSIQLHMTLLLHAATCQRTRLPLGELHQDEGPA